MKHRYIRRAHSQERGSMEIRTGPKQAPAAGNSGLPLPASSLGSDAALLDADVFSKQLLVALLSFRDGDFTARLPLDLVGIRGKVADTFNDIARFNERRAREIARVSHAVGKEGKIRQRIS